MKRKYAANAKPKRLLGWFLTRIGKVVLQTNKDKSERIEITHEDHAKWLHVLQFEGVSFYDDNTEC